MSWLIESLFPPTSALTTMGKERYGVVIFGATGFTGQFVVEEVARTIAEENGLTWAIAGRSMAKLQNVLEVASRQTDKDLEDIPIIIADVNIQESLIDMCKQAKVVLNCVGPYRFFGDQMVRAAIEGGAHHLDISGEPQYLEKMQLLYDGKAREAGVNIVGACGWDSIPADMGVTFTRDNFNGDLNSVESYVSIKAGPKGGGLHFGTWQSAIHGIAHSGELKSLRNQQRSFLIPQRKHKLVERSPVFFSDLAKGYCVPFPGSDRSVVNRTQRYNYHTRKERPLQFKAYFRVGSIFATMALIFVGMFFAILSKFSFGRKLLETYPKLFSGGMFSHEGPTREQIAGTNFTMTFAGRGYSSKVHDIDEQHNDKPDKEIVTKITGPEPGYIATPICMVQAAYALLVESDKIPNGGGVFTPGAVFAKTSLIDRLQKHNMQFQIIKN